MTYRPEIDGLRAIAVLAVILFHAGFSLFSGGYVGVDVFFVISGYLITTIIITDLERGRFSLRRFYERRARRILPALFFVLLCCVPFAWVWMLPRQFMEFSQALVAVGLFASNILFWRKSGYFAPAAEENPLLHTWSLAVEEQFYIGFPLLMLIAWRFGRNPIFWTVAGLSLLSLMLAELGWRNAPAANFYLLPTRAWEIGAGALCALWLRERAVQARPLLSGLGLGLIAMSVLAYDASTPFPSLYALAPVGGTVMIILYGGAGTLMGRLLSGRLMVGIGLISYSAYLWHQPLFAFARLSSPGYPPEEVMALLVLTSLGLAWLSWRYVELPFRRKPLPVLPTQRSVFAVSGVFTAAFVAIGLFGHVTDGREAIWRAGNPQQSQALDLTEAAWQDRRVTLDDGACRFGVAAITPEVVERFTDCYARHGPATAVIGDSHATDLYNGMYQISSTPFLFGVLQNNCAHHQADANCPNDAFADFVNGHPEMFDTVLYTQAGFHLFAGGLGPAGRQLFERIPETQA
ncbi:MAG: acyltransferase, partial [Ectothiorhodospiraceae bacterium]|nr:acyltransferase [Ectothiorhodospiraceae bacterium]